MLLFVQLVPHEPELERGGMPFGALCSMQAYILALALYDTAVLDQNGFKLKRRKLRHPDLPALNPV
jgi:hypothetical protein